MTKHYCDLCNKQILVKNPVKVLISSSFYQEYDLCGDCKKAIDNARDSAELKTVKQLLGGRKYE